MFSLLILRCNQPHTQFAGLQELEDLLWRDAEEPALSVSVGVASFPKDAGTIGTLLYTADRALYAMKASQPGSSRTVYSTGISSRF